MHRFSEKCIFHNLVVPISISLSGLVTFAIQFVLLSSRNLPKAFHCEFNTSPEDFPDFAVVMMHVAAVGMGVGLIVSA